MPKLKYIELKGQRLLWRDVVSAYREQAKQVARVEQPALFTDLHIDHRPPGQRNAAERYREPNLFDLKP
jgi:hypothetical protein